MGYKAMTTAFQLFRLLSACLLLLTSSVAFGVSKIVDGGAGTDSLTINYSGISGLGSFAIGESGDYVVLTDSADNTVSFKNIQSLTVGPYFYTNDSSAKTYHNTDEKILFLYLGGTASSSHAAFSAMYGNTDNWTITGSGLADSINLNLQRDPGFATTIESVRGTYIGGLLTINLGAGNDTISSAKLVNGDSIDMGAGDDLVSPMFGSDAGGIQTFANVSLAKLDGGSGTDTLSFNESANPPAVITLNTAGAVNFENINGTGYAETITGDDNSNLLKGFGGADTLNGAGGNDFLLPGNNSEGGSDRSWLVTPSSGATLTASLNFITKFYTGSSEAEVINGGSGDDILIGATGEDVLDGGTGRDHMAGGAGTDTFVIRSGDGNTNIDEADIVYDFTDGTDFIGLDSLSFDDLTLSEGTGSYAGYTVIKKRDTGEYLLLISNASFSFTLGGTSYSFTYGNLSATDFASTSTASQTLSGTSGNNTVIGGAGNDTITTGTGTDNIYGHGGDDSITVNGSGNKTIDGGAGTDALTINYSGISSLASFTASNSGDYTVLTDSNGYVIQYKNIESLTVGSYAYTNDTSSKTFYSTSEKAVYMYAGSSLSSSHAAFSAMYGNTDNWTITGSGLADSINLNLQRDPGFATTIESVRGTYIGGLLTINLGAGNDTISSAKLVNGDSIDMGAGDDLVSPMFGSDAGGIQTFANVSLAKLDGGSGTDTLSFNESANPPAVITLNTAGAVNFENINGTGYAETITGDDNSNLLKGFGGADTLNGAGGNDFLLPGNNSEGGSDRSWLVTPSSGATLTASLNFITKFYTGSSEAEVINGGSGDDILIGATGEDVLDGGTGRDHMAGGAGTDTFVIRSGDGNTNIDEADIVYDFTDGTDFIGLDSLSFDDLTISEGTGSYAGYTVIKKTDTGEYLLLISNASFSFTLGGTSYSFSYGDIDETDFSAI